MAAGKGKKLSTADVCAQLAAPVAESTGVYIWDVVFEKEGAGWYLRYYIDSDPDGVTIDHCEQFSRKISDILDEKDPISQNYCLEVCSPGIERKLVYGWHFQKYMGTDVLVRLIRPVDGVREFVGTLTGYDEEKNQVSIDLGDDMEMEFQMSETAYVKLYVEF